MGGVKSTKKQTMTVKGEIREDVLPVNIAEKTMTHLFLEMICINDYAVHQSWQWAKPLSFSK